MGLTGNRANPHHSNEVNNLKTRQGTLSRVMRSPFRSAGLSAAGLLIIAIPAGLMAVSDPSEALRRLLAARITNVSANRIAPSTPSAQILGSVASTYTWTGTINTDWTIPLNWSPARIPAASDILIIGVGTPSPTITNVAGATANINETIAELHIAAGVSPTFSTGGANTLTINAGSGNTGLDVASLAVTGSNALTVKLASGTLGHVDGTMSFADGAHRLIGQTAGAISFGGLSIFSTQAGFTGNPFGDGSSAANGAADSVRFKCDISNNCAFYIQNAGGSPFGASGNPSVVTFETGTTTEYLTSSGFDASGRRYSNLTIGDNVTAVTVSATGTGNFQFDNLYVNSNPTTDSALTYSGTGSAAVTIGGSAIYSTGAGSGGSLPNITLSAPGGITIDHSGTVTMGTFDTARAINLDGNVTVAAGTIVDLQRIMQLGIANPNSKTLTVNYTGALNGSATGYVIGSMAKQFGGGNSITAQSFPVGSANGFSPIDVTNASGNGSLTISATGNKLAAITGTNALSRYWSIASAGVTQADLKFQYRAGDVVGTEANYKIFRRATNGVLTQFDPSTLNTTSHFATLTGVTSFSDWTLAEPSAVQVGTISFLNAPYSDSETNTDHPFNVTVQRTGGSDGAVDVNYNVTDGTATAGSDYSIASPSGTLHWDAGDATQRSLAFTIKGDTTYEADETINLSLSGVTGGAAIGAPNPTTLTVTNDDSPPATLIVTNNTDNNGTCVPGDYSLRQAINSANANADVTTINFAIPGAGVHTITPGPTVALPVITQPVIIDGYSQSGTSVNTLSGGDNAVLLIELDGSSAPVGSSGLNITAGASSVKGLVINRFGAGIGNGITLSSNGGNTIAGNFIGTDPTGTSDQGNSTSGIEVNTGNNTIGGTTPAARNVISGNDGNGVKLNTALTIGNIVEGNFIGTNAAGTNAIPNPGGGVHIANGASSNTIGGSTTSARNIISGNGGGVQITGTGTSFNTVQGNYIGTNVSGAGALGNSEAGVDISGAASNNLIGGLNSSEGNVISGNTGTFNSPAGVLIGDPNTSGNNVSANYIGVAADGTTPLGNTGGGSGGCPGVLITNGASNNTIGGNANNEFFKERYRVLGFSITLGSIIANNSGDGIRITDGNQPVGTTLNNALLGNSIYNNGKLGINLVAPGENASLAVVTANDSLDVDNGPNLLQNFPAIGVTNTGATSVSGILSSSANKTFTIELFANTAADSSGNGEGRTFLGSTTSSTNGSGNGTWTVTGLSALSNGQVLSATATDPAGNTSEFSQSITVSPSGPVPVSLPVKQDPTGGPSIIPISVGNTTGLGIFSYSFDISFNPAVLQLQTTPYDTSGTITPGDWVVTPDTSTPGHLMLNAFGTADLSGQGLLLKLKFNVVGASGATTPLTFVDFTFNEGSPDDADTNGTFTVLSPTASGASIRGRIVASDGQPIAGTTVTVMGGPSIVRAISDSDGFYKVEGLPTGGFYTVTPTRANYQFVPSNRSLSLLANSTDALFTGAVISPAEANPLDSPEFFVRQQYLDFLGREPEQAGLDFWSAQLRSCGSNSDCVRQRRLDVSAAFFIAQEFQDSGLYLYDLYQGGLGRRPAYAEYARDRRQVIGGPHLEADKAVFLSGFVEGSEFINLYPLSMSGEVFVESLIQRAEHASGLDLSSQRTSLTALYDSGANITESRGLVLRRVVEEEQFKQTQYNPAFVLSEYFSYLNREPDRDGYAFWLNVLNTTDHNNYRGMVCSFLTSAEYQQRFSSAITRTNAECR